MTIVDWIIVGFTLLMAIWGFAQGLIVGALSLLGFAGGAFAGSRLGPLLLSEGSHSPYAPLFALAGALLLGGLLAGVLEAAGFHLRHRLGDRLGILDGIAGALLLGAVGLGLCWITGSVLLQTPGASSLRKDIQRSEILGYLNDSLPPSGPILNSLARFDPLTRFKGPEARVGRPNSRIARDPQVKAASGSVVRILGTACGLGVQGSGWVARDGTVVTNAHVVAGQSDTTVQPEGTGPRYDAQAIYFDPENDVAVLHAGGLPSLPSLSLKVDAKSGSSAAVLGFPKNGPYDVEPARLGQTSTVISDDAYGRGPVRRSITNFRGKVRGGNSGGPVVDGRGRVVTTVFAAGIGSDSKTGYGVPDSIAKRALSAGSSGRSVSTGPCAR